MKNVGKPKKIDNRISDENSLRNERRRLVNEDLFSCKPARKLITHNFVDPYAYSIIEPSSCFTVGRTNF